MKTEKNVCSNPQLEEKKEERMKETIQTNNQDITKPYRTGFALMPMAVIVPLWSAW